MIKNSFVIPEGPKVHANKTGMILCFFYFNILRKLSYYDAIHDFLVWMISGANSVDFNRFKREKL